MTLIDIGEQAKRRTPEELVEHLNYPNPFVYVVPVLASQFIGRKREVGTVLDQITSPARGNVALSGQLGIGKTSLLRYIVNPDVAQGRGLTPDRYILLYLDCQSVDDFTPTGFWQRVLGLLARHEGGEKLMLTIERLNAQEEIALNDVEALLDDIHDDAQKVLVLLLDEFEWLIRTDTERDERITHDFLSMLNVLARRTPRNFSLILATEKPLVKLCHPIGGWRGSPFPVVFLSVPLKPFTQEEAEELIAQALNGTDVEFTECDRDFVYQKSQGHPCWLQNACFMLFAGKLEGLPSEGLYEEITLILREKVAEPSPPDSVVEEELPQAEVKGLIWKRLQSLLNIFGRAIALAPRFAETLVTIMKSIAVLLAITVMIGLAREVFLGAGHTEILPFVNATGDERYEIGKAMAECLVIEYEEIRQTHSVGKVETGTVPRSVVRERLRVGLRPTEVDSLELKESLGKVPEIGVGGIRVQIGELLLVIKRLFRGSGTIISGSIQKYGSTIRIVARKVTNGELKGEWAVTKEKVESDEDILDLIQDLAFQMAWDLNDVGAQSWEVFKDFTEGLKSYQKYRLTKNPAHAQEAIEKYKAALSKQPTYPIVHYNLGVVYSNLDESDEALQEYEEAAKENPNLIGAFYNAGLIYLKQRKPGGYDRASNMFREVVTKTAKLDILEDRRYRTLAYSGLAWAYAHKYYDEGFPEDETLLQQAMAASEEALKLDPDLAEAHGAKGRVLDLQEKYDQAIEQYTKAIEKDPSYHDAYWFRGRLYAGMNKSEAARSDLTRYLELVPNASDRKAVEDWLESLGGKPTDVPTPVTAQDYYERALEHFELEEYPSALDDFTQVISMTIALSEERKYANAYYKRGSIYQARKDDEAAIKDFNRYLELVPDAPEREQLEEYIATTTGTPVPSTAEDYYNRGIQRLDAEEYELALEDLNQALALEPDLAKARYARGKVHRLLDHAEAATSDFRRYLELAPNAPDRTQVEEWIGELAVGP